MGAIGGSIWHFVKGMRNSPRGQRLLGSIDAVKITRKRSWRRLDLPLLNTLGNRVLIGS
jgi:hypothetical protein